MKKIGVTATRNGLTAAQVHVFDRLLREASDELAEELQELELHHGDCVGGDATIDQMARHLGIRRVSHPPVNAGYRAWCDADDVREPRGYVERDHDIVEETEELWVGPGGMTEQQRSGTWLTARYARKHNRPLVIVWPDGRVSREAPQVG